MADRTYEFNWDIIGDIHEGRPNLGGMVNLVLYRLMQFSFQVVAVKKFSEEGSDKLFLEAGNIAGRFFFDNFLKEHKALPLDAFLEKFRSILDEHGIRFVRIDSVDTDKGTFALSIATGIAGVELVDNYHYDVGFTEGVLSKYAGKDFTATTIITSNVQDIMPKMGDQINLIPYRMLQYTVRDIAEQKIGTEACDQLFYDAGEVTGTFFFDNFMAEYKNLPLNGFVGELQRILKELGVGVLGVEKADAEKGEFTLTVSEDLDCSGLPDLGIEVCNYDEGFIASVFCKFTGVAFHAKEVDCWCSGDRTCRFVVNRAG
jgi:predicted hydrocarbon binding protein